MSASGLSEQQADDNGTEDCAAQDAKIVMALCFGKGELGCAYIGDDGTLHVMSAMPEDAHFDLVKRLRLQVNPQAVLLPGRTELALISALRLREEGLASSLSVDMRPTAEFSYERSLSRMQACSGWESFKDCGQSLRCVGALLVNARMLGTEVRGMQRFSPEECMAIGMDALLSLQVFDHDLHPNMHSTRQKEGFSLFGLLNRTRSEGGHKLLRTWTMRPLLNTRLIEQRLDAVAFFASDGFVLIQELHEALARIAAIPSLLLRMRAHASIRDFQSLLKFVHATAKIKECLRNTATAAAVLRDVSEFDSALLLRIGRRIVDTVDFDRSLVVGAFTVKPLVNERLDELRQTYNALSEFLARVADELDLPIPGLNVVYFPQLGFLATIPAAAQADLPPDFVLQVPAAFHVPLQFVTEKIAYFKCDRIRQLDTDIGDVHTDMVDIAVEIQHELTAEILPWSSLLSAYAATCAQLDWYQQSSFVMHSILSLALVAKEHRLTRPVILESQDLFIRQGRHLLQEQSVDCFVANDCELNTEAHPAAMLLTGANSSGKSVYMKMVGLIVLMAQIGCFVPAREARIGIVDAIYTRIKTRESVSTVCLEWQSFRTRARLQ